MSKHETPMTEAFWEKYAGGAYIPKYCIVRAIKGHCSVRRLDGDIDRDAPRLVAGEKGGRGRKRGEPASENGDSPRTGSCEGEGQGGAARPTEITPKMRRSSSSPVAWFDRPSHTTHGPVAKARAASNRSRPYQRLPRGRYVGRSHSQSNPFPDRVRSFAHERENVGQEGFDALVHWRLLRSRTARHALQMTAGVPPLSGVRG
jgi:hypothetical protein